jgi:hypothetical protein
MLRMSEVHYVTHQLAPRSEDFPGGQIAEGFFSLSTDEDGTRTLVMTNRDGEPVL